MTTAARDEMEMAKEGEEAKVKVDNSNKVKVI